jgi:hypothetical protein
MEKLILSVDSKWPHYPETHKSLRLANFIFFEIFQEDKNKISPKMTKSVNCGDFPVKFGSLTYLSIKKMKMKSNVK